MKLIEAKLRTVNGIILIISIAIIDIFFKSKQRRRTVIGEPPSSKSIDI